MKGVVTLREIEKRLRSCISSHCLQEYGVVINEEKIRLSDTVLGTLIDFEVCKNPIQVEEQWAPSVDEIENSRKNLNVEIMDPVQ